MSKTEYSIAVFCDFDGTITYKDTGNEVVKFLGEFEPWHTMLHSGEMPIRDYWRKTIGTLRLPAEEESEFPGLTPEFFAKFIQQFDFNPYFADFAGFCAENGIALSIISDGFSDYIKPALAAHGCGSVPVFANSFKYKSDGTVEPFFYAAAENCSCMCASCKRNVIISSVPSETIIVTIGDGMSDLCAARHSDIIFAKKELAAGCNAEKLPHYDFKNFFDVLRIFKNLINPAPGAHKIRPRYQAQLMRKRAFEAE